MKIMYKNTKIEKLIRDEQSLIRKHGAVVAAKVFNRINDIKEAPQENYIEYFKRCPGGFHPLKGNRKGQHAFEVGWGVRLVFRFVPIRDEGVAARIEYVGNYHPG